MSAYQLESSARTADITRDMEFSQRTASTADSTDVRTLSCAI